LRQGVSLTGLGTPLFDAAVNGVADIFSAFARCIAIDKLAPCNLLDTYDTYTSIDLCNRYFTPRKDAPTEEHVAFNSDIDPKGFLTLAAGNKYIHAEQNIVKYYNYTSKHVGVARCATHTRTHIIWY
jgi:hypothetical protein